MTKLEIEIDGGTVKVRHGDRLLAETHGAATAGVDDLEARVTAAKSAERVVDLLADIVKITEQFAEGRAEWADPYSNKATDRLAAFRHGFFEGLAGKKRPSGFSVSAQIGHTRGRTIRDALQIAKGNK